MKLFREKADHLFRVLLLLESAIIGVYFLDRGFGHAQALDVLVSRQGEGTLTAWISSIQLLLIGVLFFLSSRRSEAAAKKPSGAFLLSAGIFFLGLAWQQAGYTPHFHLVRGGSGLGNPFGWLPAALVLALLLFRAARRSFIAMWTNFHRESVIILAGLWILLFGTVGLEAMQALFLRNGAALEVALKAFLEMTGGTVILYGVLLFRQKWERWHVRPAIA